MSAFIAQDRVTDTVALLQLWDAPVTHRTLCGEYLAFLDAHGPDALSRAGGPAHLTGSCYIFTPVLDHVLLCFHRKGQFWVQVGGHIESSDSSVVAAALREAREESGLADLAVVDGVLDLDRHDLSSAFGRCSTHWDVGVVALSPHVQPKVSDESEQVAWFPIGSLPENTAPSVPQRVATMVSQLR